MLCNELLKCTEEGTEDYSQLQKVVRKIKQTTVYINDQKRQSDSQIRLQLVEKKSIGSKVIFIK